MKRIGLIVCIMIAAAGVCAQTAVERMLDSLWITGEYQTLLQQAMRVQPPTVAAVIRQAEALTALAKFSSARKIFDSLDRHVPEELRASFESARAYFQLTTGRSDRALEQLQATWAREKQNGRTHTVQAARILSLLSNTLSSLGQYNEAVRLGEQALAIRQNLASLPQEELAASYNDLGLVYSKIDPDRALAYYEQALPLYESLHGSIHPKIAIINTNMGYVYNDLKLYGDAITNFETALVIWQKIFPQGHPNEAFVRLNLGRIYAKLNNTDATKAFYRQALALYRKSYGSTHPDIAATLNQLGVAYLSESQYDSALSCFQQALISNAPGFTSTDLMQFPRASDYYNGQVLLFSLQQKSRALEDRYFGKTLAPRDLTGAIAGLLVCDSLIDRLRRHHENQSDKLSLSALATEVYQDGVRLARLLSEVTPRSGAYRELSFYFAEKSKSAVLQEAIADTKAKSFAGIPPALLEQEQDLKTAMTLIALKIQSKPTPDEEQQLRQELFARNEAYQQFVRKLETDYPAYFNLKYRRSSPSVRELQQRLAKNTALVSYFLEDGGPGNQRLYVFTITKKKFRLRHHAVTQPIKRLLAGFQNGLYFSDVSVYRTTGTRLSKWLRPAVPRSVTELVLIPDSHFSTLPFEALPRHRRFSTFSNAPYWTDRLAISYQFSSNLMADYVRAGDNPRVYLCAPIDFTQAGLARLPGTEAEVKAIAELFVGRSEVNLLGEATETTLKSGKLRAYDYLHFATHGFVDATHPELSRLILQPSASDDGNLYSGEIYNLELQAKLAVLSACQTGLGKVSKGEGVIGLSRALVYAGVQNLIVSFWRVSDQSTMQLMHYFYEHLQSHPEASFRSSLQAAKHKLKRAGEYRAPYYWAPFVLIGS